MELLKRLHREAENVLPGSTSERRSREEARTDAHFQLGFRACKELLVDLDPREGTRHD